LRSWRTTFRRSDTYVRILVLTYKYTTPARARGIYLTISKGAFLCGRHLTTNISSHNSSELIVPIRSVKRCIRSKSRHVHFTPPMFRFTGHSTVTALSPGTETAQSHPPAQRFFQCNQYYGWYRRRSLRQCFACRLKAMGGPLRPTAKSRP